MPKKKSKLAVLAEKIAVARRIIDEQQASLEKLYWGHAAIWRLHLEALN
jgi:hypothetical protein